MKMGISPCICTIERLRQITHPEVEVEFCHLYTFAIYGSRVISDPLMQNTSSLHVLSMTSTVAIAFSFYKTVVPNLLAPGTGFVENNFSMDWRWREGWFGDDSSILHLLLTLFLLSLHQLHLRSSGIRFDRLGTPALRNFFWSMEKRKGNNTNFCFNK